MKPHTLSLYLLVAIVVGCVLVASEPSPSSIAQDEVTQVSGAPLKTRTHFSPASLLDFERFKKLFKKSYYSLTEEAQRRSLFLGRALRVLATVIFYNYRHSTSYLAINYMSDWTRSEVQSLFMKPEALRGLLNESKLIQEGNEGKRADLTNENRSQNDQTATTQPYLDLMRMGSVAGPGLKVPSNNRHYLQPEVMSCGPDCSQSDATRSEQVSTGPAKKVGEHFPRKVAVESAVERLGNEQTTATRTNDQLLIDHRASLPNCLGQVRRQGRCGACYAFAAVGLYEWHLCRATGGLQVALSEQYVIDCGHLVGLSGCNGGIFLLVSNFVNAYGLELRLNYPYREQAHSCPYWPGAEATSMGYLRTSDSGFGIVPLDKIEERLRGEPLVVNLLLSDEFVEYGGGVDKPKRCRSDVIHSVLLVGSGIEDGHKYWLFKNSLGVQWGFEGYYKMSTTSSQECMQQQTAYRLRDFTILDADQWAREVGPKIEQNYEEEEENYE